MEDLVNFINAKDPPVSSNSDFFFLNFYPWNPLNSHRVMFTNKELTRCRWLWIRYRLIALHCNNRMIFPIHSWLFPWIESLWRWHQKAIVCRERIATSLRAISKCSSSFRIWQSWSNRTQLMNLIHLIRIRPDMNLSSYCFLLLEQLGSG